MGPLTAETLSVGCVEAGVGGVLSLTKWPWNRVVLNGECADPILGTGGFISMYLGWIMGGNWGL